MLHSEGPTSPGAIIWIQQCGLVHCSSRTVPARVTVRVLSNMAAEWWASADEAASAAVPTRIQWTRFIISLSPRSRLGVSLRLSRAATIA